MFIDYPLVIEVFDGGYFSRGLHADRTFVQELLKTRGMPMPARAVQYGYGKMCGHGRKKKMLLFDAPARGEWPGGKFPVTFVVML